MQTVLVLEDSAKVGLGGGQRVTLDVMEILGRRCRCVVLDPAPDSAFVQACRARHLPVHRLHGVGRIVGGQRPSLNVGLAELLAFPPTLALNLVHLAVLARQERATLVYATTKRGLFLAVLAREVLGLPFVFHAHSVDDRRSPLFPILRAAMRRAERIVCVSRTVAEHLDLPQAVALPNPVGLRPDARPRHLPGRPLQVASLSALLPWKGVEHFVRAAAHLRQPDRVALHVFGGGPEEPALRRLAGPRVTFHGAVRDVAERLRHEIDLVVLPSIQPEACPMANLEAMAEGVPVITTRIGGGAEFVRDGVTGVHVPVADPAAIAAAIDGYLADPGRYHAHSKAALEHVQAHGRDRYAEQLEALFSPWLDAGGPLSRPPAGG